MRKVTKEMINDPASATFEESDKKIVDVKNSIS